MRKILPLFFAFWAYALYAAPIDGPGPAIMGGGGNMTSFNNQQGAVSNNQYNQMLNPERDGERRFGGGAQTGGGGTEANFGNCNAIIQRCASPKCAGGCTDLTLTTAIVKGCVEQSSECKKHGDALTNMIAAQIVAGNQAKANNAANAAQAAAARAAEAQSAQQMQQMSAQMQQMQQQMAAQQAESAERMQAALEQQQQATQAALRQQEELLNRQQVAAPAVAAATGMQAAIDNGVSADTIARSQIVGQVMSSLDGVDAGLKSLKATVQEVIEYAGCDYNANSCTGPKRVAVFRKKARAFFEPYDNVLDALEGSLTTAMAAGVDVTEIYMMLTNSCNQWAKYLCTNKEEYPFYYCKDQNKTIDNILYKTDGPPIDNSPGSPKRYLAGQLEDTSCGTFKSEGYYTNKVINPRCQLLEMYKSNERDAVQQNWLIATSAEDKTNTRMACISDGVLNTGLFGRRNRKKSNDFDIDALEMIINQDEPRVPQTTGSGSDKKIDWPLVYGYCYAEKAQDAIGLEELRQMTTSRKYKRLVGTLTNGVFADSDKCLDNENLACYANPAYAMCTTHIYNAGANTNEDETKRKEAAEFIALKATVIAQQLKKQNDLLATTAKQMKAQMQKAAMTAQAEASGARSSSSSGNNSAAANQIDCRNKTPSETATCVRNNMTGLQQLADSKSTSGFRSAVENNSMALQRAMSSADRQLFDPEKKCSTNLNMQGCITELYGAINTIESAARKGTGLSALFLGEKQ